MTKINLAILLRYHFSEYISKTIYICFEKIVNSQHQIRNF